MTKQKHALWFVMLNEVKHLARVSARLSQATQDRLQPHIGAVTKKSQTLFGPRRLAHPVFPSPAKGRHRIRAASPHFSFDP
jgi:hypothetical protein